MAVVTAEEFYRRQVRRTEITLPTSGLTMEVRRLDLEGVILKRRIPAAKLLAISQMFELWGRATTDEERAQAVLVAGDDVSAVLEDFVVACVVSPRITSAKTDGAIWVEDLTLGEKIFIITQAQALTAPAPVVDHASVAPIAVPASAASAATSSDPELVSLG